MWRVLLVSGYPAMRAGLRALLSRADDLHVVGEAGSGDEVLAVRDVIEPDVVLMDLNVESGAHLNTVWRLRRTFPAAAILVLTDSDDDPRVLPALQVGASGFLPKTAEGPALIEAARTVAAGGSVLAPNATAALLERLRGETPTDHLTPREVEVLQAVSAGLTNKAIAQKLGISEHTVKFHLGSAMSKLAAASRAEAVTIAIRRGLISV